MTHRTRRAARRTGSSGGAVPCAPSGAIAWQDINSFVVRQFEAKVLLQPPWFDD